jgi:hypothetical protein
MPAEKKSEPKPKSKAKSKPRAAAKTRVQDLRAEERFPERIPVSLRVQSEAGEIEHGATTIDISIFGLQVETHGRLDPGQLVTVPRFGDCVVVWVRTIGPGKPYQAGLKMVR